MTSHNLDTREKLPICERLRCAACGSEDYDIIEEAADTIEELYEALTDARANLKHSVGCQSHWHGLPHCDCGAKQLITKIDTALSRARNEQVTK